MSANKIKIFNLTLDKSRLSFFAVIANESRSSKSLIFNKQYKFVKIMNNRTRNFIQIPLKRSNLYSINNTNKRNSETRLLKKNSKGNQSNPLPQKKPCIPNPVKRHPKMVQ